MACPSDQKINEKVEEKLQKYQKLTSYEVRERRPGYHVGIIPVVIGYMRGGTNKLREQIAGVLETNKEKDKDL